MSTPKSKRKAKPRGKKRKKSASASKSSTHNIEVIITLILFFGFIIYGAGQCNKAKVAKDVAENPSANQLNEVAFNANATVIPSTPTKIGSSTIPATTAPPKDIVNLPKLEQKVVVPKEKITTPGSLQGKSSKVIQPVDTLGKYNRLWVTIDQLKLRDQPSLKSEVIYQMPLYDRVFYLDVKTPYTTKINLGLEVADEPWLLVQHPNGKKGWAYGAGLDFHKQKSKGVN